MRKEQVGEEQVRNQQFVSKGTVMIFSSKFSRQN